MPGADLVRRRAPAYNPHRLGSARPASGRPRRQSNRPFEERATRAPAPLTLRNVSRKRMLLNSVVDRTKGATAMVSRTAVMALVLVAGCTGVDTTEFLRASRQIRSTPVTWKDVQHFTFDDAAGISGAPTPQGAWRIESGKLHAVEGDGNRTILLASLNNNPMSIAFDATLYPVSKGRIGDITVLINATDDSRFFSSGYALTTGSYWNNCTTFYRLGKALARTEWSPLRPGRTYHVRVELVGGHLRYWLNNRILLEAWDPQPLALTPDRWVGIRTWATHLVVDNLTIQRGEDQELPR